VPSPQLVPRSPDAAAVVRYGVVENDSLGWQPEDTCRYDEISLLTKTVISCLASTLVRWFLGRWYSGRRGAICE
jgi:hypothetical protein